MYERDVGGGGGVRGGGCEGVAGRGRYGELSGRGRLFGGLLGERCEKKR